MQLGEHARPGKGRDALTDIIALHIQGDALGQGDNAQLGRGVVGLTAVPNQPDVDVMCTSAPPS